MGSVTTSHPPVRMPDVEAGAPPLPTRERIPQVALALFVRKGYDATSMREIAEQLGITKAALYYHFDSKEGIVEALLAEMFARVDELVEWVREQPRDADLPREILRRWCDIMQLSGLDLFRFAVTNRATLQELKRGRTLHRRVAELQDALTCDGASTEAKLRARMALGAVNMAGMAALDLDVPDEEILAAARAVAFDLLPTS